MKIEWKMIGGHGPYAYARRSVREGRRVRSIHVAYLGRLGGDLTPGAGIWIDGDYATVPPIPETMPATSPRRRGTARQYVVRDADGRVVYVGQSSDVRRRAAELRRDGTVPAGGSVEAETGQLTRAEAERQEARRLDSLRRRGEAVEENEHTPRPPGARNLGTT